MFVTQLVAPLLLLAPVRSLRKVGVLTQLPLQVGIMLAGLIRRFQGFCVSVKASLGQEITIGSTCTRVSCAYLHGENSRLHGDLQIMTNPFLKKLGCSAGLTNGTKFASLPWARFWVFSVV